MSAFLKMLERIIRPWATLHFPFQQKMAFDNSLYEQDAGYYPVLDGKFWLPGKFIPKGFHTFSRKAIDAAANADLDDSDVLIANYPKTGQTWTMQILNYIFHAKELEDKEPQFWDLLDRIPFMEAEMRDGTVGADKLAKLTSPRFMKTHTPYQIWQKQLEKHLNLRVIQVIRNPKDTLVSYYHHMQNDHSLGIFKGTWNQFFQIFKEEKLPSGDFFQVTYDRYRFNKDRENSLVLVYEEMKKDPKAHIIKIANFINQPISDKVADVITEKTSVKQMSAVVHDAMKQLTAWNPEKSL